MFLITKRDVIKRAIIGFRRGYGDGSYGGDRRGRATGVELRALDPETATDEELSEVIGHPARSWTTLKCDECGQEVDAVVQVGEEQDYDSATANVCTPCLQEALKVATIKGDTDEDEKVYRGHWL